MPQRYRRKALRQRRLGWLHGPHLRRADACAEPVVPMSNPVDIKHIGKLLEELGEGVAAAARCLIQGIDGREPVTGKPNLQWFTEELADITANTKLCVQRCTLDMQAISTRAERKEDHLRKWHAMTPGEPAQAA